MQMGAVALSFGCDERTSFSRKVPRDLCSPDGLRALGSRRQKAAATRQAHGWPPRYASPRHQSLHLARYRRAKSRQGADWPRDRHRGKKRPWMRIYANTDIVEERSKDAPEFGSDEAPPPISGWIQAKGVVEESTPNGDEILMGAAANQEEQASDPRGPANAAQSARLLYRRLVEMFPNSPLAPAAAWRAADIQWQIEKADASSRPSAHEKEAYMREQMDEDNLKKVIKL